MKCQRCKEPYDEDSIDGWTPTMISAKITELENKKEQLWKDYCDKKVKIELQIEELQKKISNESVFHEVT